MKSVASHQAERPDGMYARLNEAVRLIAADPGGGELAARALVLDFPGLPAAYRILALAERQLGRQSDAEQHELQAIATALDLPVLREAELAIAEDRLSDAEPIIRAYLRKDPEDPAGALMLGEIAARSGSKPQAENLFRRAILLAPAYGEARMALAKLQRDDGRYDDALETLDTLLAREAAHLSALSLRAAIMVQLRDFDAADATFRTLLAHHPRDARAWANYAFQLKTVGRLGDAVTAYRRALDIDPAHEQAWWGLANLKTVRFSADDVAVLRAVLERGDADPDARIHLHYALGKALDDQRDYGGAFASYAKGAAQRLERVPHDPERVESDLRRVRQVFTPDFLSARKDWGDPGLDPIFIVSLPRSGSTLIEQILASHPLIEGTEELFDIERIALELAPGEGSGGYVDHVGALSPAEIRALGAGYIEATRRVRKTDRPFFTDKMPSNWIYLGLINLILPNARIIDVRRHPLGCGFANFSQHFNWGINFSYDLEHIGRFYAAYVRQMAHFEKLLPNRVLRVTYETLVDDFEAEVCKLLTFLGLPFDEACLRFFDNPRAVHTPSSEQVRRPINREGVERWLNYEPWLGPLKQALGPVLDAYPGIPAFDEQT